MYKCGWNGCEKAYGTLNHLNAHVTMQSHGAKRTPEGMWCCTRAGLGDVVGILQCLGGVANVLMGLVRMSHASRVTPP